MLETDAVAPDSEASTEAGVTRNPYGALAAAIARASTGERAALARLDPDQPLRPQAIAALSRALVDTHLEPENWHPATWRRWALVAHGMALAGHDSAARLGAQLARALVAESRVTRLLTARGDAFTQLLPRLLRLLASRGVRPNWYELGPLIHKESKPDSDAQQEAETIRLGIAKAYFLTISKSEKSR
ncbi:type I-E CRISPR-associated protein Cse2/CasB [uncultured Comamonas sp.]|uniref:type I-E CRISPR-associated protein Cse2/CasB n=1 Tax=uncultured Comamonas sp. TaxID=114710 RepID=UPI002632D010|nr:type I-E CRISPR-associated protein Cse2/CasB [uncultured Comamonas sp.]